MTSERQIEEAFIAKLLDLKYEHRPDIRDRAALEENFRKKFEELNRVALTDNEFYRLLNEIVTSDVYAASRSLRTIEAFTRDDGTPLNYTLVNIKDWCKNTFEVINQLRINTDYSHHRYDVILLINGIPVVQIELKTLGMNPKRAMEQIVRYKNDPGNGFTKTLLCFVQLFIVSNREETLYFTNNNKRHFTFDADEQFLPVYQFATRDNSKINHLDDFADCFLPKCTLGHMISKYMVLIASEQKLLMMRPYQIYAVEAIVDCINQNSGNGYIWHTTGSGKTLTSFKASTLLKTNESIHKCLFVVDRKDLDRQTREEFNRFQENCVEENTDTAMLVRRLLSDDYADKVIVTTIQKLGLALNENSKYSQREKSNGQSTFKQKLRHLQDKRMVFIFDECHRSQFGEYHRAIREFFPQSQLFGFTGTPIFEDNASITQISGETATLRTTEDLFEQQLHAYTITHAIDDGNVLRFHIDYFQRPDLSTQSDTNQRLPQSNNYYNAVARAILMKHNKATDNRRFNALLATESINDAIKYFEIFKEVQAELQANDSEFQPLKIVAVFSPPAEGNKDIQQIQEDLPTELEDNQHEPEKKKAALSAIIADYNEQYGTNHDINNFDLYYQNVQKRIKDQQFPNGDLPNKGSEKIDITIVVDMLLTGFDARYLNTLYIDKNLKYHGLIQAFSRTNRVLNSSKPFGHILDFCQQQDRVDDALALFSGESADHAKEIWLVDRAPVVVERFTQAVNDLKEFMQSKELDATPHDVTNLKGDAARAQFIILFKKVQKLRTQIGQYTDLSDAQREQVEETLSKDDLRAFKSAYLETAGYLRDQQGKSGDDDEPNDPIIEQPDFELVLFASALIDYDYIIALIAECSSQDPEKQTMTREELISLIQSDAKFLDEREDLTEYIRSLPMDTRLNESEIRDGYQRFKDQMQAEQISSLASKHLLGNEALSDFVNTIIDRMVFDGEQLTDLMEPLGLSWRDRHKKELTLMAELFPILNKRAQGRVISGLSAYERVVSNDNR